MMSPLQQYLYGRKLELLEKEKRATGTAQLAMTMQLQVIEGILNFLASKQTEEDMAKLKLTLEKQATPLNDIKPRQENQELTDALIDLSTELKRAWELEVKAAEKEKRQPEELKFPLNALPEDIKPKSVSSKIYGLRKIRKLPEFIVPKTRTIRSEEQAKHVGVKWDGKPKEVVFMAWVKNPPPINTENGD